MIQTQADSRRALLSAPGTPAPRPGTAPVAAVRVRPARMDDEDRVRAFVAGLSLRSQSLRFFGGVSRPGRALVSAMVTVGEARDVLLAVDAGERIIGHAMSFTRDGSTEIAVVVADEWQGVGLGSRLVRRLLARAVARGATAVTMDVMGENRKVLSMVARWWPHARMRVVSGTVEIAASLEAAPAG
ncbi:GNAT family N-acetyltransferase [Sphaerisporangium rhizosphaerae]|uniref:GNAT family N-acetyltransferase n=1 Tax=Sphaerisporangium rhizosphaerae TaxID=2269375 RepID=A0ABW2PBH5_9ACTN